MTPPSLKHPGRWLWLALLVPLVIGFWRLRFDVEVFDLLPQNLSVVQGLKLYQAHFANARELIVTLRGSSAEDTENAARKIAGTLRNQPDLVAGVTWEPPWLEHPGEAAELIAYLWFNQPPAIFGQLTNRLAPQKLPALLAAAREQLATTLSPQEIALLSYDPFGLTRLPEGVAGAGPAFGQGQEGFSSADGTFRILFVQAATELRTYRDCQLWLAQIKNQVEATLDHANSCRIGYTGRPAFVAEVSAGMEHDITTSVGGTAAIIAILFWLAHRRLKPMLWLLTLLAAVLGSTLAFGGLIFGTINVVSTGFAAILLGLAVDYAVVHYQEALAHPDLTIPQIRHAIAPSILWAAVTTIAAFLALNFGGLPGLGQLGTLVGVGVALAAVIMIFEFLPPLFPGRNKTNAAFESSTGDHPAPGPAPDRFFRTTAVLAGTALLLVATGTILLFGLPRVDPTANALRPRNSPAYAALDEIQAHLNQRREPLWLLMSDPDIEGLGRRLEQVEAVLDSAVSNRLISGFRLPAALWPRPEYQQQNRTTAARLVAERDVFHRAALAAGFADASLGLADRVLDTWKIAPQAPTVFWPTNRMSRWIFGKFTAATPTNYFVLGLVNPLTNRAAAGGGDLVALESRLPRDHSWLSGWELLGGAIFNRVKENLWKVLAPMVILVLISLWFAFRRPVEVLLSVGVLLVSGLCLLAVMRIAGWSWNLLNLMAVPLILGTGVDYSIFMQLALRRHHGDLLVAYRSVGRALLLCGGTAVAGFGSLSWSSNAGMASLGRVCAVGIASNMLLAIFLLPTWWEAAAKNCSPAARPPGSPRTGPTRNPSTPSSLYRSGFWKVGLWIVRILPQSFCEALASVVVRLYSALARHRREVVIENLLPPLAGDKAAARKTATVLFHQFALKIVHLWRYEAGLAIDKLFGASTGWNHFTEAQAAGRGVLILTPHLGNWEFGGPLLSREGVRLQVITLAEPGDGFTDLRRASRARWNIETIVIRNDPFAFLDVIRRLEEGATVALLVDRPPEPTAVEVTLFGRPFAASIAAAELARASGCALVPVYLPRRGNVYEAHVLPPIPYERAKLRDRAARQELTQRIIQAFEPVIADHLDQWYHFVPVWPRRVPPEDPSPSI
jgi:uncharacterized protein